MNAATQSTHGKQHQARYIGAMPLLNWIIERLKLEEILEKYVPAHDKRQKLEPAIGLLILLRNILVSRHPLCHVPEWVYSFDPALLGLSEGQLKYLNDDRLGRDLDLLFRANRQGIMTEALVQAIEEFDLTVEEIHNDSTSIMFHGQYLQADGTPEHGQPTQRITYGHSKEKRPDLKQLLYILTTTADGNIPIWAHIDHGNTTDDVTHLRTWKALCKLLGTVLFLYVADCKLCTKENLAAIHQQGGRFLTVVPATWSEHKQFHQWLRTNNAPWADILSKKSSRRKTDPPSVYRGYEPTEGTAQGFRIMWFWSSQKAALDRSARETRINGAEHELQQLRSRVGKPKSRLRTVKDVEEAAQKILRERNVEPWITFGVTETEVVHDEKAGPGRPGPNSLWRRRIERSPSLHWQINIEALQEESRTDGVFPLTTNDKKMSMREALDAYKRQPGLEKRFSQLKTVFELRPVLLQNHLRIEAFLYVYFLAMLVQSLLERETRNRMKKLGIKALPIYAEQKPSEAPTAGCVLSLFEGLQRYRILDKDGRVVERYYGELNKGQRSVLEVLGFSQKAYLTACESD
jgi:transposase